MDRVTANRKFRILLPLAAVATLLTSTVVMSMTTTHPVKADTLPATASAYVALTPARILDTRTGTGPPPSQIDLQVTGRGGVPANGVTAVVFNVTAVNAQLAGYVTVWPTGQTMPVASNLNLTATERLMANMVVVPVGTLGQVSLFTQTQSDLVVDVSGYFTAVATATAGRLQALTPARVVDTRIGLGAPRQHVAAGSGITVKLAGIGGIPTTGVSAVAINVTSVCSSGPGFLTVWPEGETRPLASNVNPFSPCDIKANMVWSKLGSDGAVDIYSNVTTDVVVDVVGYFTDGTAANSTDGLFVPLSPLRLQDTRLDPPLARPFAGDTHTVAFAGFDGVPTTGIGAVLFTFTVVDTAAQGFFTVFPSSQSRPPTSSVNATSKNDIKANLVVSQVTNNAAQVAFFYQVQADSLADVAGYFTGTPYVPPVITPPPPTIPTPTTLGPPPVLPPILGCAVRADWSWAWGQIDGAPTLVFTVSGNTISWTTAGVVSHYSIITDNQDGNPYWHFASTGISSTGTFVAPFGNISTASFCVN